MKLKLLLFTLILLPQLIANPAPPLTEQRLTLSRSSVYSNSEYFSCARYITIESVWHQIIEEENSIPSWLHAIVVASFAASSISRRASDFLINRSNIMENQIQREKIALGAYRDERLGSSIIKEELAFEQKKTVRELRKHLLSEGFNPLLFGQKSLSYDEHEALKKEKGKPEAKAKYERYLEIKKQVLTSTPRIGKSAEFLSAIDYAKGRLEGEIARKENKVAQGELESSKKHKRSLDHLRSSLGSLERIQVRLHDRYEAIDRMKFAGMFKKTSCVNLFRTVAPPLKAILGNTLALSLLAVDGIAYLITEYIQQDKKSKKLAGFIEENFNGNLIESEACKFIMERSYLKNDYLREVERQKQAAENYYRREQRGDPTFGRSLPLELDFSMEN